MARAGRRSAPFLALSLLALLAVPATSEQHQTSPASSTSLVDEDAVAAMEAVAYPSPFILAIGAASREPMEAHLQEEEAVPLQRNRVTEEELMFEGAAATDHALRLAHLVKILDFFGFTEIASAAHMLQGSPILASWPGPWTVFAAPDSAVKAAVHSGHPSEHALLLLQHITLGSFVPAEIAEGTSASTKLPTGAVGTCLTVSASTDEPGLLRVDGVEISYPELYNDGRLVVHGLNGVVMLPSRGSCSSGSRRRQRPEHVAAMLGNLFRNMAA